MDRKNIFDIMNDAHDIKKEVERIKKLLYKSGGVYKVDAYFPNKHDNYTLFNFADEQLFKYWKNRGTAVSFKDFYEVIGLDKDQEIDLNYLLNYCEYAINIVYLVESEIAYPYYTGIELSMIEDNIKTILNWYGYEVKCFPKKEMALVVNKSAQTTAAAEIVSPDLAYLIVEYNHFLLKGNITRKREILLALGADLEPKRAIIKSLNKELEGQIFALLNNLNIRHNNKSKSDKTHYKEYVAKLKPSKLEEWYDELYQQILLAYLLMDNQERSKKIKELIENINSKETDNGQDGNEE